MLSPILTAKQSIVGRAWSDLAGLLVALSTF